MGKSADRSGNFFIFCKHAHFVTDTAVAQMCYPQAAINDTRVRQRLEELALRLRDQANYLALFDIQQLMLDQELVHDAIDVTKVHRVINVPIGIVIDPPGTDLLPIPVIAA